MSEDGYIFVAAWLVAAAWTFASALRHGLPPSAGALCALAIPLVVALLAVVPWWVVLIGLPALSLLASVASRRRPPERRKPEYLS